MTSVDIVTVFAQRSYIIGRRLNLVTEEYYDEAIQMARLKDTEREQAVRNNEVYKLGTFHGIPISVKDHVSQSCIPNV